jgi:hypothetical protein
MSTRLMNWNCRNSLQLERRDALRFNVRAHVELFWQSDGRRHCNVGLTRDVSAHGAYVWTHAHFQTGSDLFIKISLQIGAEVVRLTANGKVLRVDSPLDGDPLAGIAVSVCMFKMTAGRQ